MTQIPLIDQHIDTANLSRTFHSHDKLQDVHHQVENDQKYYKHENNYNYLLNINIRSMTKNKIKELENEMNEMKNNLENYKKLTIKQIWTQELDELIKKYNEWDNTQINTLENKLKEKNKSKKGKN